MADIARQSGRYSEIHFVDDNSIDALIIKKCADYMNFISPDVEIYPAFGNNVERLQWIERLSKIKAGEVIERDQYPL